MFLLILFSLPFLALSLKARAQAKTCRWDERFGSAQKAYKAGELAKAKRLFSEFNSDCQDADSLKWEALVTLELARQGTDCEAYDEARVLYEKAKARSVNNVDTAQFDTDILRCQSDKILCETPRPNVVAPSVPAPAQTPAECTDSFVGSERAPADHWTFWNPWTGLGTGLFALGITGMVISKVTVPDASEGNARYCGPSTCLYEARSIDRRIDVSNVFFWTSFGIAVAGVAIPVADYILDSPVTVSPSTEGLNISLSHAF